VRISVGDGQVRELVNVRGTVLSAPFSPDGRLVAYRVHSTLDDPVSRIFVTPSEGGEPHAVYEERQAPEADDGASQSLKLLDRTADGRFLAISSARMGRSALYLLPIRDGKSPDAPILVRYGDFEDGLTLATGELIYRAKEAGRRVVSLCRVA